MAEFRFKTASKLLDHVFSLDYFHPDGKAGAAIPYHRVQGRDPLVVMVGDNASGKSFARRIVSLMCRKNDVEAIAISMERRAGPDFSGGIRSFIYGDEGYRSTGENSASTVITGIKTCQGRDKPHLMFWDEPDIGLSDSWAAGCGVAIRKFAEKPPEHTRGIFVVTHSKALVSQLLPVEPHYIHFGDGEPPATLADWLTQPIKPRDIEKLGEQSHARFKKIQKILDQVEKKKAGD